jgi:hypothetical protein
MSMMKDTLKPLWNFSMIAEEDEEKQVDVDVHDNDRFSSDL